jgi:hypothetical protein
MIRVGVEGESMRFVVAALMIFAAQEPAAREEGSGFVFSLPKGWMRRDDPSKATILTPRGGDQEASVILYPISQGSVGSAQEFHDTMLKAITTGSKVEGDPQTGTTGNFQWSRMKVTPQVGPPMWVVLYTAKSGSSLGAAVFGAASEKALATHGAAAEELLKGMTFVGAAEPAPAGQTIHGLVLPLPAGWTRKEDPSGTVALFPPPPKTVLEPTWDYVIYVLPSQTLQGTHWQTHKAIFQAALKSSQLKDPVPPIHEPGGPGPFIRSESAGHDAAGGVRTLSMYSALSDGKVECLVIHNQEDRDGLRAIFARATPKNPPKKLERPKIVEAYRRVNQTMYINRDGGALIAGTPKYERIWLRSAGVADFSTTYPEGYAASTVVFKHDPGLENGSIGSWKARGDTQVQIVRTEGAAAQVYQRENGRLRFGDQQWQPMPPVDGMRLDGRWTIKPNPGATGIAPPKVLIEFTNEGRFKDDGVLDYACLYDLIRGKPPKKGAGTYELRDWTVLLKYDDGVSWSTDFSTIGTDPKDHSSILFGVYAFQKE